MQTQPETDADRVRALSANAANRKLADTKRKLGGVSAKIRNAVSIGRIDSTEQLRLTQHAVELDLLSAEQRIEELRKSDELSWEARADEVDSAWEDLSQSVKKLVARFSDMAK